MAELVDPSSIEGVVGVARHATEHYGRAVSAEQTVYVLHSAACKDSGRDLRACPFSLALDRGIEHWYPQTGWRRLQDVPVPLVVSRGFLLPDLAAVKVSIADHPEEYHRAVIHPTPISRCDLCRDAGEVPRGGE